MAEPVTAGPGRRERAPEGRSRRSAGEPSAPDAPDDGVADVLRRLQDAATAHDED